MKPQRQPSAPPQTAEQLALQGEAEYRRGDAAAAASSIDQALKLDRKSARAQWVLGNLAQDEGKLEAAIAAYRRALRADPRLAEAHNDLGTAYFAKSWHSEAEQCYLRALELQPEHFAAAENLGAAMRAQGKLREARNLFVRALKLRITGGIRRLLGRKPRSTAPSADAQAHSAALSEARELLLAGKTGDAEARARVVLARTPDEPDALHLLACALAAAGKRAEAIRNFERAIALRSSAPEYYVNLANVLADERRYDEAIERCRIALMLDPANGPATANIARILQMRGFYLQAEEVYRLSLEQEPDLAGAQSNLAGTLRALGRYAEAEAAARKALEMNPRLQHAALMLADVLLEQNRVDEAQGVVRDARRSDPDNVDLLRWTGHFETVFRANFGLAETLLEKAVRLAPEKHDAHFNLARALLVQGKFARGWEEYEWRRRNPVYALTYSKFPYPDWRGEPLAGKSIVVVGEQGLGDEVMFASCLEEIAGRASRCVLLCARRLEPLFRRSFPFAEVLGGSHSNADNDPFPELPGVDLQVAAGSLPRFLRRDAAEFPAHRGYLKADEAKVAKWRSRLAGLGAGELVGLSWRGGTPLSDATRRTLKLDDLRPLLSAANTHWISLQFGDTAAEREAFTQRTGIPLHHWQEALDDLDETAALMCALDLRISVCNTQVHLSGAQGQEVWVLAPFSPDWRYGYTGESMPWYPAARMFRQRSLNDWSVPLRELEDSLRQRLRG